MVHTDDVAWNHARFGWDDLMLAGILAPLHAGRDVHYQPPAWQPHGRSGSIDVSADTSTVVIEGVAASRRQVAHLLDVAIWVQSDFDGAKRCGLRRDLVDHGFDEAAALQNWDDWAADEVPSCSSAVLGSELLSFRDSSVCPIPSEGSRPRIPASPSTQSDHRSTMKVVPVSIAEDPRRRAHPLPRSVLLRAIPARRPLAEPGLGVDDDVDSQPHAAFILSPTRHASLTTRVSPAIHFPGSARPVATGLVLVVELVLVV